MNSITTDHKPVALERIAAIAHTVSEHARRILGEAGPADSTLDWEIVEQLSSCIGAIADEVGDSKAYGTAKYWLISPACDIDDEKARTA